MLDFVEKASYGAHLPHIESSRSQEESPLLRNPDHDQDRSERKEKSENQKDVNAHEASHQQKEVEESQIEQEVMQ